MGTTADSNWGFKGTVSSAQTPQIFGQATRYSIEATGHLKATAGGTGDRAVTVTAGSAWGDGVLSKWDTGATLNAGANATAGVRWDTLVIRRTWTPAGSPTGSAVLMILAGGVSKTISASRTTNRGVTTSDQPIALLRINAGAGTIADVVDLRCWAGDGGLVAAAVEALQYLTDLGSAVRIGDSLYTRTFNSSGSVVWVQDRMTHPTTITNGGIISSEQGYSAAHTTTKIERGGIDGRDRHLFVQQAAWLSLGLPAGTSGDIANHKTFRLINQADWPEWTVDVAFRYTRNTSGAQSFGHGILGPDGYFQMTNLMPGQDFQGRGIDTNDPPAIFFSVSYRAQGAVG